MNSELRRRVRRRARGRCEYCRIPFRYSFVPGEVDHVIAAKHGGPTSFANLAWACVYCNSHKGTNIAGVDPQTRAIVRLFNPRTDRWADHFTWRGPLLVGLTPESRTTVHVLSINDAVRVASRTALIEEGVF